MKYYVRASLTRLINEITKLILFFILLFKFFFWKTKTLAIIIIQAECL